MKYFLIVILSIFTVNGDDDFYLKKLDFIEAQQLKTAVNFFEEKTGEALAFRAQILQFAEAFDKDDKILSGADLESIQVNVQKQLQMRETFYRFITTYKNRPFLKGNEGLLFSFDNQLKGGMTAIAAAAILYDNFCLCYSVVHKNGKLRRLINKGDKGFKIEDGAFREVVESFHSPEKRSLLREALDWYYSHAERVGELEKKDPQIAYLSKLIDKSPSVQDIKEGYQFGDYVKFLKLLPKASTDSVVSVGESSMNSVSKVFGNSLGLVQTRNGLLFRNEKEIDKIKSNLKPMDVLLEKTPFRLTDKFIPGHFGHVAIWIGSEEELKAKGLWENPLIKPHQKDISEGKCVLEALRDGVQLSSLEKFMDVDDVAILRPKKHGDHEVCVRAFRQLGKEYDFNFDVETIDKIVCSELVYQVFTDVKWPTEKALGRYTISPDNVAIKAHDGPFELVLFYHDGKVSSPEKYKELVQTK